MIDLHALGINVDDAPAAGVAGFLVPAMASEVQILSQAEKYSMVELVLDQVGGECLFLQAQRGSLLMIPSVH